MPPAWAELCSGLARICCACHMAAPSFFSYRFLQPYAVKTLPFTPRTPSLQCTTAIKLRSLKIIRKKNIHEKEYWGKNIIPRSSNPCLQLTGSIYRRRNIIQHEYFTVANFRAEYRSATVSQWLFYIILFPLWEI